MKTSTTKLSDSNKKKLVAKKATHTKLKRNRKPKPGTFAAILKSMEYAKKHPIDFEGW